MTYSDMILAFFVLTACFLLARFLTARVKDYLLQRSMLDIPNDRSSHTTPVPRGGGWALLAVIIPALAIAAVFYDDDLRHTGLIAALFLLAVVSWLDDRNHVGAGLRLSMHILAACLGSFSFPPQEMLFGGAVPFWLDRTVMIIGWAWFINLYNFMDGIDGITALETIFIAAGVYLVMLADHLMVPFTGIVALVLVGVSTGFLVHNRHPAKIFLGDVGSVPVGYLVGFCLISLAVAQRGEPRHLAAALILPLYYLADSGITIAKRAWRGEKIWQAHREHFYQRAAWGAGRHNKVTRLISLYNGPLLLAAFISLLYPAAGLIAALLIVAVLLRKLHKMASNR